MIEGGGGERRSSTNSRPIDENLCVEETKDGPYFKCVNCDYLICPLAENYIDHVLKYDGQPSEAGPNVCVSPGVFVDEDIVFRQLYCPSCFVLLSTEIIPKSQAANARSKMAPLTNT